jgi:hypothetical protein
VKFNVVTISCNYPISMTLFILENESLYLFSNNNFPFIPYLYPSLAKYHSTFCLYNFELPVSRVTQYLWLAYFTYIMSQKFICVCCMCQYFLLFFSFIIHMCIQGLGHFSPLPPLPPLPPSLPPPSTPTPSIPSRNYFVLISNFVVERV